MDRAGPSTAKVAGSSPAQGAPFQSHIARQLRPFKTFLGYQTVEAFVHDVAQNFTHVHEATDGRLNLVYKKGGYDRRIVVEKIIRQNGEPNWTVITGLAERQVKQKLLYVKDRSGGREPAPGVAKHPRFATLSLPKKK